MYPETARTLRLRGMVSANVVIHKDGRDGAERGGGAPATRASAVAAVQQWKYETHHGQWRTRRRASESLRDVRV